MNAVALNVHPYFHHLCCLRARRRERRARSDWGGHLLEYNSLRPNREMSEAATPPSISRGRSVACHECGRPSVRLKLDGRLYKHKVPGTAGVCQASGEFPALVGVSVPAPAGAPLPSQPDTPAPNVIQQVTPPIFLDRILGRVGFLKPIRRIPKAARSAVAALLTSTIQWVCGNRGRGRLVRSVFLPGEGSIPPGRKSACTPSPPRPESSPPRPLSFQDASG